MNTKKLSFPAEIHMMGHTSLVGHIDLVLFPYVHVVNGDDERIIGPSAVYAIERKTATDIEDLDINGFHTDNDDKHNLPF